MNSHDTPQNITLSSCEYTPVYLIQNNGITQATSYVLAPTNQDPSKPITNNLKLFYENSGNLENSLLLNNTQFISKAVTPGRSLPEQTGNNLKLASFLVSKNDVVKKPQVATVNSRVLKPSTSTNNSNGKSISIVSSVVNVEREEITKVKKPTTIPQIPRTLLKPRILPKIKPKEEPAKPLPAAPPVAKHTSFQLLKLGGTYHSLNQLNEEQMRLVNKALETLGDPVKSSLKPSYDPVSNTKIVYKVVSPSDLKVVGKNKVLVKEKAKKKVTVPRALLKQAVKEVAAPVEAKVTRSGRKVKLPKHIQDKDDSPPKVKKRNPAITCFQCSMDFASIYRLQRHYEKHPTHIPSNTHTNLYHCLLAVLRARPDEDKAKVLLEQLEELVGKLRSLLPCLLRAGAGGPLGEGAARIFGVDAGNYEINMDAFNCVKDSAGHCRHNPPPPPPPPPSAEPILPPAPAPSAPFLPVTDPSAPFLPITEPTETFLTVAAPSAPYLPVTAPTSPFLHVTAPSAPFLTVTAPSAPFLPVTAPSAPFLPVTAELKPSQLWLTKHQEEIASAESEGEDAARVNPVDKWQVKRVWKHKMEKKEKGAKKVKFDPPVEHIELGNETQDNVFLQTDNAVSVFPDSEEKTEEVLIFDKKKGSHAQFHSAHFDIRSSPIKPSAAIFSKFQIVPEKLPSKSEVQFLRPLMFDDRNPDTNITISNDNSLDLKEIFKELSSNTNPDLISKETDMNGLSFGNTKEWQINNSGDEQSHDSFLKPNNLIEPAMLHLRDNAIDSSKAYNDNAYDASATNYNDSTIGNNASVSNSISASHMSLAQGPSVLNFLDSLSNDCLTCPEAEMRNNPIDFQLDLFSFNHT